MEKIIVTGHNGFIGSHLIQNLQNKFHIIGISEQINKKFPIKQIKKDIKKITPKDIPKDIFCIIHLAALTDVTICEKNPRKCFETNVLGTLNMLEIARKINSKLIYLSTSHVYGKPQKNPINENHPTNPISIYATSKLVGEFFCESYSKSYGLDITIPRLFSVYGPESPNHHVISKIISQLSTNKIKLGNLYPKRDFIYINDVIMALELILNKMYGFEIYNIGTGKSYSILQICNILQKIARTKIPITSVNSTSRKNEIKDIRSNSHKIKKLGWKPLITIHKGLEETYEWNKPHLAN